MWSTRRETGTDKEYVMVKNQDWGWPCSRSTPLKLLCVWICSTINDVHFLSFFALQWVLAFEIFIPLVLFFILLGLRQKKPAIPVKEGRQTLGLGPVDKITLSSYNPHSVLFIIKLNWPLTCYSTCKGFHCPYMHIFPKMISVHTNIPENTYHDHPRTLGMCVLV